MAPLTSLYSNTVKRTKKSIIRELLALTEQPDIISFAGGLPDPDLFPLELLIEISEQVIREHGSIALQYGPTPGVEMLKEEIVKISADTNEKITTDNVLITTASQQGLDLVGKAFIDRGDTILLGLPTYLGGLQSFGSYGANFIGIELDEDGIKVDLLEQKLEELIAQKKTVVKFIYIVPDFQNPSGVTLSLERRKYLLKIAKKYDLFVVEDSPYRELRFDGSHIPSLQSLDEDGRVITLRTFSKSLIPGFRIGYVIANTEVIDKLLTLKQGVDLCTANFNQYMVAEICRRGLLKEHIKKISAIYKQKRNTMLETLKNFMPIEKGIKWCRPEGGLFLWLTFPESFDTTKMFKQCVAEEKVAYIIGSAFCCDGSGKNNARMNFSFPHEDKIVEGVKRLGRFVDKHS